MKKILLSTLLILFAAILFAQSKLISGSKNILNSQLPASSGARSEIDTLGSFYLEDPCSENLIIYTSASGYVNGNNNYDDKEKVQLVYLPGDGKAVCSDVLVFFGDMIVGTGDGSVKAVAYSIDGDGAPDSKVGESDDKSILDCDTSGFFTAFAINDPDSFEQAVFIGIDFSDLYSTNDSIGIISTEDGCGDGLEVYEKWSDNTWHPYNGGSETWELDIALLIYGVIDFTPDEPPVGIENFATQNNLTIYPVYPNPSINNCEITYGLSKNENVVITIYDASGRQVAIYSEGNLASGTYSKSIDVNGFSTGNYFYCIEHNGEKLFSKFSVIK